ncbi:MAG TPA: response regulator transcription factor [Anaerolineaceae bacterium]|nr:response regulator transcription factor [Anaerolineaceae bacterium]
MINVVICDDQVVVCEGLRAILSTAPGIEVVGIANDGEQAIAITASLHPDVVLMDLKMPVMNGVEATRKIHTLYPDVKILVLSTYDFDEWVFDAIRGGASGYLLKDTPRETLIEAIQGTAAGKTYVDPGIAGKLFSYVQKGAAPPDSSLTRLLSERELEVLRLLARGLSNADIAQHLFLSEGTVRNYVSSILTKLEVTDRTQAAVLALRAGLANAPEGSSS